MSFTLNWHNDTDVALFNENNEVVDTFSDHDLNALHNDIELLEAADSITYSAYNWWLEQEARE